MMRRSYGSTEYEGEMKGGRDDDRPDQPSRIIAHGPAPESPAPVNAALDGPASRHAQSSFASLPPASSFSICAAEIAPGTRSPLAKISVGVPLMPFFLP